MRKKDRRRLRREALAAAAQPSRPLVARDSDSLAISRPPGYVETEGEVSAISIRRPDEDHPHREQRDREHHAACRDHPLPLR